MTARRVAWLLAAGVALIAVANWLSSRRHLERDLAAGALVLPGLQQNVNAVTTVNLRTGDGTHVTLSRQEAGWSVAERGWPADVNKVRKLLLDLGALNIVEEKTRLAANYPALGVEDVSSPKASGKLVEIVAPGHSWAIIIGKSSSGKSGYVRLAGAPQSLLAAPLLTVDADPKDWLDRALVDLNVARVRQIEEKPAEGPSYSAAREKKEESNFTVSPLPKGRELTGPGAAEPIAGALSALTLDDVRKAEAPASAPLSHAVFRTFDGLEVELTGRKDGTHSLVAISARSTAKETADEAQKLQARLTGWEFEIPDYRYGTIFKPLEELLQKPPEPAKKAAAAPAPAGKHTAAAAAVPAAVPSK
ncbi:MAG TPA: DUF4340 domain-containing protein [Steroidobacteraceae bacterium]|nr:DUF4340 domain-containing protein [Steroidobacteraceae bacterium]